MHMVPWRNVNERPFWTGVDEALAFCAVYDSKDIFTVQQSGMKY